MDFFLDKALIEFGFKDIWQERNPFSGNILHFYILNIANEVK